MPDMRPTEPNTQTTEFSKRILYAPTFQLSSFPIHQPQPSPRHTLWTEPDHSGVRRSLKAALLLGRCSVHRGAVGTDLGSKPNIVNACAALQLDIYVAFVFKLVQPLP